jgi:hypothetical protein
MPEVSFVLVSLDMRYRGAMLVVLGIALGALDAISNGVGREIVDAAVGALFFGSIMYWFNSGKMGQVFAQARTAAAAVPEASSDTRSRSLYAVLVVAVFFLVIDLVFRHNASDSGIVIGGGLRLLAVAARIDGWEGDNGVRLLREAGPTHGLSFKLSGGVDISKYRLAPTRGQSGEPVRVAKGPVGKRAGGRRAGQIRGTVVAALGAALVLGVFVRNVIVSAVHPHTRGAGPHGAVLGAIVVVGVVLIVLGFGLRRWAKQRTD